VKVEYYLFAEEKSVATGAVVGVLREQFGCSRR